jgi:integrase/recombinase XerD
MNIKELIDSFLQAQDGLVSDVTRGWYRRYLKPLEEQYGDKNIVEVNVSDLRLLFSEIGKKDYSEYTRSNFIRVWKRLFHWAFDEGLLPADPARKLRRPHLPPKSPSAISEEDIRKILEIAKQSKAPQRNYAMILFLADTGARVGGVASLTTVNLDLKKRRAIVLEKGRGGKKERLVFFTEETAIALENWLSVRPNTDSDKVFLIQESGIYQVLKRLAKKAGIKGHWNPHAFRHAFARRMLAKGMSIGVVSHLMGHSSIQVTVDFYGRFSNDELQEIYDHYTERNFSCGAEVKNS